MLFQKQELISLFFQHRNKVKQRVSQKTEEKHVTAHIVTQYLKSFDFIYDIQLRFYYAKLLDTPEEDCLVFAIYKSSCGLR